jgi:hypothetical protein
MDWGVMPMNRQRQVLLAIAGVAGLLVAADRVLLGGAVGGPQSAQAAGPAAVNPSATPATSVTGDEPPVAAADHAASAAGPSLAQRLAAIDPAASASTPDAFTASSYWDRPTPAAQPAVAPDAFDPAAFARQYPLSAITLQGDGAVAMVGGRAMRVGERREGVELVAIHPGSIEWRGHGRYFRVRLHTDR